MIFSTLQLSQLTGFKLTLRQLQWLDEQGIVQPRHVGHHREYDGPLALAVLILWKLRAKGLTLHQCRPHMKLIRKAAKGGDPYFVVHGEDAEIATIDRLIDLFDVATGPLYIVDVDALRELLALPMEKAAA